MPLTHSAAPDGALTVDGGSRCAASSRKAAAIIRQRELAVQEGRKIEQQIVQAKSQAELERQKALDAQNSARVATETKSIQAKIAAEQETEKITATIAAEMRKDVAGIAADAQLKVAEINLNAAKIRAEINRVKGEAEAQAKFLVENERALGVKRRAEVFKDSGTLADLRFVDSLGPDLSIRVLHSGEGTLWTDLKGPSLALPSSGEAKRK